MNSRKSTNINCLKHIYSGSILGLYFLLIFSINLSAVFAQKAQGDSLLKQATSFQGKKDYQNAILYSQRAAKSYKKNPGCLLGWLTSQSKISYILQLQKLYHENIAHMDSVLDNIWTEPKSQEENKQLLLLNLRMGYCYYNISEYVKSIKYYEKAKIRIPLDCFELGKSNNNLKNGCVDYDFAGRYILYPLNLSYLAIGDNNSVIEQIPDTLLSAWKNNINIGYKNAYDPLSRLYSLKGQAYLGRGRDTTSGNCRVCNDTINAYNYLFKAYKLPSLSDEQKARNSVQYGRILHYFKKSPEDIKLLRQTINQINSTSLDEATKNEISSDAHLFLSYIHRDQQNDSLALNEAESAINALQATYRHPRSSIFISPYISKAILLFNQNKLKESRGYFQKALACILSTYHEGDPIHQIDKDLLEPKFDLLNIFIKMGEHWKAVYEAGTQKEIKELDKALSCYRLALETEKVLKSHYVLESSRLEISRKRMPYLGSALDVAYTLWSKTQSSDYLADALFFFEKSQARELQKTLELKQLIDNTHPDLYTIYQTKLSIQTRKQELQNEIDAYEDQKTKSKTKLTILQDSAALLKQRYIQLSRKFNDSLKADFAYKTYWLNNDNIVSLDNLQKLLDPNEALISFFESSTDNLMFILYVTSSKAIFKKLKLDKYILDKLRTIKQFVKIPEPSDQERVIYQKISYELYQSLISPITQLNLTKLVIIPSPILHDLPLEVLLTESTNEGLVIPYRNLKFLWQNFRVRYLEAASLMMHPAHSQTQKLNYLGFAPDYSLTQSDEIITERSDSLITLKHNQEEISKTANIFFNTNRYRVFISNEAIDSTFVKLSPDAKILHLSMHANIQSDNFSLSYLQFLQTDKGRNNTSFDGKLFMNEIYKLRLKAELTILSACETGVGQTILGEGIMSLGRAFQFAGSQNILMSLWKVDDYSSSELIPIFMKYIQKGYDKDEALQKARREFIFDQKRPIRELAPYYWAPFVLYGDDLPVSGMNTYWILWGLTILSALIIILVLSWRIL